MQYFAKVNSFQWIVVKLKRILNTGVHVYFEPVCPHIIYQALAYLKSHNKLFEDISISKGLLSEEIIQIV